MVCQWERSAPSYIGLLPFQSVACLSGLHSRILILLVRWPWRTKLHTRATFPLPLSAPLWALKPCLHPALLLLAVAYIFLCPRIGAVLLMPHFCCDRSIAARSNDAKWRDLRNTCGGKTKTRGDKKRGGWLQWLVSYETDVYHTQPHTPR